MNATKPVIIPAILASTREELDERLLALQGIATQVQVDVVDGEYAGPASWPYAGHKDGEHEEIDAASFTYQGSLQLEVDLMVQHPERDLTRWVNAGASRVVVHADSARDLTVLFENFNKQYGYDKEFAPNLLSLGLALGHTTDFAVIAPHIAHCDYVQFMGISNIGKQGQPFDETVLERIKSFRKEYPSVPIQVDGAVSLETAPHLLEAGASQLVIGSALWKAADLKAAYAAFVELTERYGIYA